MANTEHGGQAPCAGCGSRPVPPATVLCPPCSALLATASPIRWAAPTVHAASAPTLRVPAYVPRAVA